MLDLQVLQTTFKPSTWEDWNNETYIAFRVIVFFGASLHAPRPMQCLPAWLLYGAWLQQKLAKVPPHGLVGHWVA